MYQAAVFIHLGSGIIWIGGSLFLALVLIPVMRRFAPAPGQPAGAGNPPVGMLAAMARRFRVISWVCIVLMIATGLYILPIRYGVGFGEFFSAGGHFGYAGTRTPPAWEFFSAGGHFIGTLQLKVALVAVVVWLSFMHDFILGPYVNRLIEAMQAGDEPHPRLPFLRKTIVWIARVNVALIIIIVAVAITMTRGVPA